MISVIVPVYKAEKYLHRCVDSILAQTYTDFELLLIDDGSPDNSGAICDEYATKDSRVRVFHKENGGVSSARNLGLDNARGDIICFVDSDDWTENDFLEIFKNKTADIVVQGYYNMIATEILYMPIEQKDYKDVGEFLNTLQKADNLGYLWTKTFKRDIIESYRIRFNCSYKFCEDMDFILRYLFYCKTFTTINKGAYHYVVPDNILKYSDINPDSNFLCTISIMKNYATLSTIPDDMQTIFINRLSSSIFSMYRNSKFNINDINDYIRCFCNHYGKIDNKKALSKKSHFIYYVVGGHLPHSLHRFYRYIINKL